MYNGEDESTRVILFWQTITVARVEKTFSTIYCRLASKLVKENGEVQVATLVYCMGSEAENVYETFDLSDDDQKNVLRVLEKFDDHFVPKRNIIHERAVFNQRVQKHDETVESFVRSLYELSEHCNFGEQKMTWLETDWWLVLKIVQFPKICS